MTKLEDRLRRDLPDLADALIAHHDDHGSAPVDRPDGARSLVTVLPDPLVQQPDHRWRLLLVAASVVLGLVGAGMATNALRSEGNQGNSAPVVAAQLEEDSVDRVGDSARAEQHRAELIADPPGTLDEARVRWKAEGPTDYRYRLRVLTRDRTIVLDVEVTGSVARRLEPPVMPAGIEPPAIDQGWIATVEELFAFVAEAAPPIMPKFDPELGYPTVFRIDPDENRVGDDLTFRIDELTSSADIELAERALFAWLPEPSPMPPELVPPDRVEPRVITAETELYQLHDAGDFVVNLVRQQRDVCILIARRDSSSGQFRGASQSHCRSVIKLRDEGVTTGDVVATNPNDPLAFLAILPAGYHGRAWQAEVTSEREYELQSTDQSVLVVFGDDGPPGMVRIDISCECGDLVYEPRIG